MIIIIIMIRAVRVDIEFWNETPHTKFAHFVIYICIASVNEVGMSVAQATVRLQLDNTVTVWGIHDGEPVWYVITDYRHFGRTCWLHFQNMDAAGSSPERLCQK